MKRNPIFVCGATNEGSPVIAGAFEMADTYGVPLYLQMELAKERGWTISIPHYFASAIEHGWDKDQVFGSIRNGLESIGKASDMEMVQGGCMEMFMNFANSTQSSDVRQIAMAMQKSFEVE